MPLLKVINQATQTVTAITASESGQAIPLDGAETCSVQCVATLVGGGGATKNFNSGSPEITQITFVPDFADGYGSDLFTCPSAATIGQGDYLFITSVASGNSIALWVSIDGDFNQPAGSPWNTATFHIRVDVSSGDSAQTIVGLFMGALVASPIAAELNAIPGNTSNTFYVAQVSPGLSTPAESWSIFSAGTGATTVSVVGTGYSTLESTYLLYETLDSAGAPVPSDLWFRIDTTGVAPLLPGRISIDALCGQNDSAIQIATQSANVLNINDPLLVATRNNAVVTITNLYFGPVTDAANGPFPFSTGAALSITQGTTSAVNVSTNIVTITSHGFATGAAVQLTSTGTLPGGLSLATTYYIINLTANTLAFATSLANAMAGTKIDLTTQGSSGAVHTITGSGITVSAQLQTSSDNSSWSDEGSSTPITASGNFWLEKINPAANYMRVAFVIVGTGGSLSSSNTIVVKGFN